jgi:predicted  nucleic acid-binding Zn-ribbon protein
MAIMYDFECHQCGKIFESLVDSGVEIIKCECGYDAFKIFPQKSPSFKLVYDPKKDICDFDGNTTQYYRKYEEAKARGENVRLPEQGE